MKKVSIVLPTYNGSRFLQRSIQSCLTQSYSPIELIVVDDCSTDDTPRVLAEYVSDARVKLIRHDSNLKLPAALNTGFAVATGDYLSWTSDDNEYAPDAIGKLGSYLDDHPDVGFVYADYWLIDTSGKPIRRVSGGPPENLRNACTIACFLYRREVYETVGDYDTTLFRIEDYDYWLRIAQQFRLAWLPEALYQYRRHSGSLTATHDLKDRARMFDEVQTRYFGPDPGRRNRVLGQYLIAEAFERHLVRDRSGVVRFGLQALWFDGSLIKNPGVRSILFEGLAGKTLADLARGFVRS